MTHTTTVHTTDDGGTYYTCTCGHRGGAFTQGHETTTALSAMYHERYA